MWMSMDPKNQAETPGHHLDPASYREKIQFVFAN